MRPGAPSRYVFTTAWMGLRWPMPSKCPWAPCSDKSQPNKSKRIPMIPRVTHTHTHPHIHTRLTHALLKGLSLFYSELQGVQLISWQMCKICQLMSCDIFPLHLALCQAHLCPPGQPWPVLFRTEPGEAAGMPNLDLRVSPTFS